MDYYLHTTIQELFDAGVISRRTLNCLTYEGFKTIFDVKSHIEEPGDLMKIRNFGRKSYMEMSSVLFKVKDNSNNSIVEVVPAETQKIFDCIEKSYNSVIDSNNKLSSYIQAKYISSQDLHKAIVADISTALSIEPDLSLDDNIALRKLYLLFVSETLVSLKEMNLSDNPIYPMYKRLETELGLKINDFSLFEKAHYFMPRELHNYIEGLYKKFCQNKLSVRANNFVNSYLPTFEDMIKYFDKPFGAYSQICPGKSMKKTLTEIFLFNQSFKALYLELCEKSNDELNELQIKHKYPYLLSTQRRFVTQFIKTHKHAPLFYILHEYLRISEDRTDKIFSFQHGLFDNKKRSLAEIASIYNITRERARQISLSKTTVQKDIHLYYKDLQNYDNFLQLPYICEESNEFVKLRKKEHLTFSFDIFAAILSLIADYKLIEVNEHTIAINQQSTLANINFNEYITTIESLTTAKFAQDTEIPIENILKTFSNDEIAVSLLTYIADTAFRLKVYNGKFVFKQNFVDVSEELYKILAERGKPMTVPELFEQFKVKYPDHPYSEAMQIKAFLYRNEHIRSIGKQSLYGLDSWKNIYFGSIRDLMYEIISNSDNPVDIGEIYEQVVEYFPDTNIKSIASSLQSDTLDRFVSFEDGYFGIKGKEYGSDFTERRIYQRYNFEERMNNFREFVETYHRFPLSNGGEEEASLRRWYYNVENCIIDAPSEEALDKFLDMIEHYNQMGIPRTGYESEFLSNCEKYQDFINSNYKLPSAKNGEELYWWLKRSLENYDSYIDHRRQYLTMLINYIRSLGFSI